jgi:GYF domain 2
MKYFLQREGRSFGPYSFDDLKRYQSEGRIGPDDKIRAEDSEQWVAQTEFFNPPAPTPPAAPVPVFMPPPAPVFMPPSAAPTPAPNPFASPTDANPVWNPPTPPQQQPPMQSNPFAAPGAAANPFGAPPAQGGFGAPPAQGGFGAPPAQGFGGPPAGGGFAPNPAASGAWPTPPEMQWWLVLLIGVFCGFFVLYWFYTQLVFVKKIDPQSKAMKMILGGWGLLFGGMIVAAILGAAVNSSLAIIPILVGMVCYLGGIILAILGIFDMRTSIERHYNTVENIGLKLSPVMTFFFDIYYFQYHFSRIAEWKKTGRLAA